ncbi:MAG TPA: response regulator [Opitutaceae bacterium]|nr:response regulator [Opitutaceae bacterium]
MVPFASIFAELYLHAAVTQTVGVGSLRLLADTAVGVVLWLSAIVFFTSASRLRPLPLRRGLGLSIFFGATATILLLRVYRLWPFSEFTTGLFELFIAIVGVIGAILWTRRPLEILEPLKSEMIDGLRLELENSFASRTAGLAASNEAFAKEIRQREEAEAEVRRLNASLHARINELQALLDLLPIGIGIAQDPACREIRSNKIFAQLLGISPKQNASLSSSPLELPPFRVVKDGKEIPPEDLPMRRAARENQPISNFEETIVRHDGREVHVVVNAVPLRDANGEVRGCVATMQDVSEQRQAVQERLVFERRLQETQKLESLGILAGGIAHDFNNLLTGIIGNASIARLELPEGNTAVRAALDSLENSAMRAADLCKQMLAYAGKGRFVVEPLSLSRIVRETSDLLGISILRKSALHLELAEGLPAMQGDATQIRQVVMNLVINAAEAIGDKAGLITVRTSSVYATSEYLEEMARDEKVGPGNFVCLEVVDTGPGMDGDTLLRIFDPFFTTKFTGRGLGLAAVLGIVRGHKGAIKAYSQMGGGTALKILFPALDQAATPPELLMQPTAERQNAGLILLVDDEEAVRNVAVRVLQKAGFDVLIAEDGEKAVEMVRSRGNSISTVLLDLTMPRMDGEEAFRQMREANRSIPIIVMSGFSEQDTAARFAGQGLSGFVPKPFTGAMLVSKIQAVIAKAD